MKSTHPSYTSYQRIWFYANIAMFVAASAAMIVRFGQLTVLFVAGAILSMILLTVTSGQLWFKWRVVHRAKEPIFFWSVVAFCLAGVGVLLVVGAKA